MTICAQKRGVGTPRSPSSWSRLFPRFGSPQGSFPRKPQAQERVKRTAEGGTSQVRCRTGGHAARRAPVSYVRNEPASLWHPAPSPAWRTVESLRLTVISPGAALSPSQLRFLCWHLAAGLAGPRLAPRPGDCWPGEQVASGLARGSARQQGGQSWGVRGERGIWEFPPWRLLLPYGAQDLGNVPSLP